MEIIGLCRRHREKITLEDGAADEAQQFHLLLPLDTFDHHFKPKFLNDADDRAANHSGLRRIDDIADQSAVDLYTIDGKFFQPRQIGITRTEIVDSDTYALMPQSADLPQHFVIQFHGNRFEIGRASCREEGCKYV